jgi:hypothetical protein
MGTRPGQPPRWDLSRRKSHACGRIPAAAGASQARPADRGTKAGCGDRGLAPHLCARCLVLAKMMVRPPAKVREQRASRAASLAAAAPPLSRTTSCVSSLGADAVASAASLRASRQKQ